MMTPYDKAGNEKQKMILREAVVANIVIGNKGRVCQEKGIPIEVFERVWGEYRETNTYHGRFFHRLDIRSKEKDYVMHIHCQKVSQGYTRSPAFSEPH